MLSALRDVEVFKRAHLVALTRVNDNTMKVWLRFINRTAGRATEEHRMTRFTALEAMSVVLMAEVQREWGTPPELSYRVAWNMVFAFCEKRDGALRVPRLGFPAETFSAAFSAAMVDKSRCGIAPNKLGEELAEGFPRDCCAAFVLRDSWINDRVFKPVLELRHTLTGKDLLALAAREAELEGRRDDGKDTNT